MKLQKYILPAVCLLLLSLSSCYEDKGNYDYHDLEEVLIDTTGAGLQPEYAIMRYDRLHLAPNVLYGGLPVTDDMPVPLDYQWTIFSATSGVGANTEIDTIGHERVLDTEITRTGGLYYVQLVVTNRGDGIRHFYRTKVAVSEVFDGGWMVFYERADMPGYSDLALIYNDWVKSNIKYNRSYSNLYSGTNGAPIPGRPVRCLDIAVSLTSGNNYIGLCTDKTLVGVSENGIERALAFKDFFYSPPGNEMPIWYGQHGSGVMSGRSSEVFINGKDVYTNTYSFSATEGRTTKFGVEKSVQDGDLPIGELVAWNAEVPNVSNYGVIVYDQTNQCFRYAGYNDKNLKRFAAQDPSAAFDVNNTGMRLLMGDWGKGTSQAAALMPYDFLIMEKDGQYYLAKANFSSTAPTDSYIGIGLYNMSLKCPDIASVTTMAASHSGYYIYYGAKNKVYCYSYENNRIASTVWTAPDENEEVTCVRIMKYYHGTIYGYGMVPNSDNLVHIATWNEATQEGHLYQYKINSASGALTKTKYYDYVIPGKVKDMAWKFSMQ